MEEAHCTSAHDVSQSPKGRKGERDPLRPRFSLRDKSTFPADMYTRTFASFGLRYALYASLFSIFSSALEEVDICPFSMGLDPNDDVP
jgi:hypothetical protein